MLLDEQVAAMRIGFILPKCFTDTSERDRCRVIEVRGMYANCNAVTIAGVATARLHVGQDRLLILSDCKFDMQQQDRHSCSRIPSGLPSCFQTPASFGMHTVASSVAPWHSKCTRYSHHASLSTHTGTCLSRTPQARCRVPLCVRAFSVLGAGPAKEYAGGNP